MLAKLVCLGVVGTVCSYTDLRFGLIYDRVTLPALAAGLLLNGLSKGWPGFLDGLGGLALGFGLSLAVALLGGYGGGDVKMTAAFGAIGGTQFILRCVLYTALIEGAVSLVVLARRGRLAECLAAVARWSVLRLLGADVRLPSYGAIPHAPWLTAGAVLALLGGVC
ncbi:MAG: prepilin peptidase [Bacillota bacterium]